MNVGRIHFVVAAGTLVAVLFSVCGCHESADKPPSPNHAVTNSTTAAQAVSEIGLIEDISPKIGALQTDPRAIWILSFGTNATPLLLEKIIDQTPSRFADGFQYCIGDVAHRLLCDVYHRPFLWPVESNKPVGGFPEVTFQDYLAFVHTSGGREKLQQMWREYLPH